MINPKHYLFKDFKNKYMETVDYEIMSLSAINLSKKINKLIDIGMMYTEIDLIKLTGTLYLFEVPMCAN